MDETQYRWFKIFNRTEFEALGLVSKTYTWILEELGQKDILVTKGNVLGITYNDVFLSPDIVDTNPSTFDGHAIYIDSANNVYLGIEVGDA